MTKANSKKIWWGITLLYTFFIYSTLGVASKIWDTLDNLLGGRLVAILYIIYSALAISTFIYILIVKREKALKKYILFFLLTVIFFIIIKSVEYPVEKIHLSEYGLLGVFLYNALKIDLDRYSKKLYLYGFLTCLIIGFIDEIIQWFLPTRVFDWRDVFLNGVGGMITLLIIRFSILKEPVY